MKREYTKPIVVFEDFTLSTNIAGDCDRIVGNPSKGTCGILGSVPGVDNLFSSSVTESLDGCQIWNDTDVYDGYCYHVPQNDDLFNS